MDHRSRKEAWDLLSLSSLQPPLTDAVAHGQRVDAPCP